MGEGGSEKIDRRGFLKGALAGGAVVGGVAALAKLGGTEDTNKLKNALDGEFFDDCTKKFVLDLNAWFDSHMVSGVLEALSEPSSELLDAADVYLRAFAQRQFPGAPVTSAISTLAWAMAYSCAAESGAKQITLLYLRTFMKVTGERAGTESIPSEKPGENDPNMEVLPYPERPYPEGNA